MHNKKMASDSGHDLRQRAEAEVSGTLSPLRQEHEAFSPERALQILHELQVHQVELEMQNEELLRAQVELDLARVRYFDLYDRAPVGYCTLSEKGLIQEANLTAANLLGVPRSAMVGQPMTRFILNEDQDVYYRIRKQLFETEASQVCELRLSRTQSPPFWAWLEATVTHDEDERKTPIYRVVMSDITQQKQEEGQRKKLQTQLVQAQKMESVGRLAGGVAHHFNNLLAIILGYTELAQEEVEPSLPIFSHLDGIRTAAGRAAELSVQLSAFASVQTAEPIFLDLNLIIDGILLMIRPIIGENITLSWTLAAGLWPVKMDLSQLNQILTVLCVNARDAISNVGEIRVEAKNSYFDAELCASNPGSKPGEYVAIVVSDTGCGMDKEALKNLFEPFYTSKNIGEGIGLGLATVYGIVKQYEGIVSVSSQPGSGSIFNVYLPRNLDKEEQGQRQKSEQTDHKKGRETILLVEDEAILLEMATFMLEKAGYKMLAATTPNQALELAQNNKETIHLLITDVVMPEMNGQNLAEKLCAKHPDLRVLFMSGYAADIIGHHGIIQEDVNFLQKPFSVKELHLKVREVLE
ncbi:MAG: response regulator [Desulfobulbus sp.]